MECRLALLTTRRLARGAFGGTRAREQAIERYIAVTDADPKPFVWTRTADESLKSVARRRQRTTDSRR